MPTRIRFNFIIICLLALCYVTPLFSQVESRNYTLIWYSADNNILPQSSVKSIIKDNYDFIWMATENGLVRYDGSHFKVFNIENILGIKSNRMNLFSGNKERDSIYLLNDHAEYILIKKYSPSKIPKDKIPNEFKINNTIYKNRQFYYNKIHQSDNKYYVTSKDHVKLVQHKNKVLWRVKYPFSENQNFFILNNILYNYDGEKFVKFVNGKIETVQIGPFQKNNFSIIPNIASQQVFFVINGNYYLLEEKFGKFNLKLLLHNYDLSKSNIISAFYDTDNDIFYMGSSTNGLLVVKKKHFNTILGNKKDGIYYVQIPFGDDQFLTTSGQVFTSDSLTNKTVFKSPADNYSLVLDKNGNIWTKDINQVYCYYKKNNFKTYSKWVFQDKITQIFEMKNGKILAGMLVGNSPNSKIYTLEKKDGQLNFEFYMNLNFNVTCMSEMDDNIIWTGSHLGFHKLYFKEKKIENIKSIKNTYVRSIYISKPNEIWVTTYDSGFYLFNSSSKKTTHFPFDKKKYLISSHCIIEDKNGFFWITSNKGLFQVSKKNLLDYSNKKTQSIYYHYYDKQDGFATNEFNGGCQPCGLLLKNESVIFPSMKGNVVFDSKKIRRLLPKSDIYFDQVEVNNNYVPIDSDTLRLKHNFERLRLFVNSPYYGNPNNLNIEIKIDGPISQEWEQLSENNISFTTLPYGTYQLTARKMTGDNAEYKYKTFTILISPAYYQTVWFFIIVFLFAVTLLSQIVKMRTKYIRLKNIHLEKKIAEQTFQLRHTVSTLKKTTENLRKQILDHKKLIGTITHDINSPLRFLAMTAQHVYQNQTDTNAVQEGIKSLHMSSFQLYNFVSNILEYSKVSKQQDLSILYNLYDLAEEKIMIFLSIAISKRIVIVNAIESKQSLNNNRFLFSIIIHNLLDNAIKNTSFGKIVLSSKMNQENIFFIIEDNGIGMSENQLHLYNHPKLYKQNKNQEKNEGMGFQIIAELLQIIKGKMKIESQMDKGTKITIEFSNKEKG